MIYAIDRLNRLRKIVLRKDELPPEAIHAAVPGGPYLGFSSYLNELDNALGVNTSQEMVGARLARLERRVIARASMR